MHERTYRPTYNAANWDAICKLLQAYERFKKNVVLFSAAMMRFGHGVTQPVVSHAIDKEDALVTVGGLAMRGFCGSTPLCRVMEQVRY
jgi:hypothetical protein